MLDLDLNLKESDVTPSENPFPELQSEYSGATSNSSVVNASNAGDQEYMYPCEYNFDILKQNNLQDDKNDRFVTKQLFPDGCSEEREFNSRQQYYHLYNLQIKKTRRGPRSRSSQYRGVTYYRRTGRWEAHIWDSGKQVYLGGFDTAHDAARTYDQAAIRFRGLDADINFNPDDYKEHLKQIMNLTKEEVVHLLRRQGNGLASGSSKYRGVTQHRWEAMGQLLGKNAYDKSAIKSNGREAVTNFEASSSSHEREPNNGGIDYDLTLRIAPPSGRLHQINHLPVVDMSEARRTRIEPFTSMTLGPQMPLVYHPHRNSVTSRFFPLYKGTSIEKCKKADSSNRGWQVQGPYGGVIPFSAATAAAAAAAAGFNHSVTGASSLAAARYHYTPRIHKFR